MPIISGGSGGSSTLTTADATMAAAATLVNANTFVDGPSASFAAGTWFIVWSVHTQVIVATVQSYWWTARLWDGTTSYSEAEKVEASLNHNGHTYELSGAAIVTLGSTTTLKVSVAPGQGSSASQILREVPDNSATTHTASRLSGIKVG